MKLMSFALTTEAVLEQRKTVTRRLNWFKDRKGRVLLKVGDLVQPVRKVMGLKKGQRPEPIGCPIEIVAIHQEQLIKVMSYIDGDGRFVDVDREGFPGMPPLNFAAMFAKHNRIPLPTMLTTTITRIEFRYTVPILRGNPETWRVSVIADRLRVDLKTARLVKSGAMSVDEAVASRDKTQK